jgi:uncharacterized protein (TIRG00374 family)
MKHLRTWLPVLISLLLLGVLVSIAPWHEILRVLSDFDLGTIILLILLSIAYYGFKSIRFNLILRSMGINKDVKLVYLSYMSAQPISLLPAGEIYRSHSLRKYTGVPVNRSIGQFTVQGILEGSAMASVLLISALALGELRVWALVFSLLLVAIVGLIRAGYLAPTFKQLNRIPFINVSDKNIELFSRSNREALSRERLPLLLIMSIIIELTGTAIAYIAAVSLGGNINFFQAAFVYTVPIIIGFISFLPGGIGLSEQGSVAVLLLSGSSVAIAVAATLVMRVTIVGLGIIYGLLAMLMGSDAIKPLVNKVSRITSS